MGDERDNTAHGTEPPEMASKVDGHMTRVQSATRRNYTPAVWILSSVFRLESSIDDDDETAVVGLTITLRECDPGLGALFCTPYELALWSAK